MLNRKGKNFFYVFEKEVMKEKESLEKSSNFTLHVKGSDICGLFQGDIGLYNV